MIYGLQCKINEEPALILFQGDWTRELMINHIKSKDLGISDFRDAIAIDGDEGCLGIIFLSQKE